jgi:hypothetical protein
MEPSSLPLSRTELYAVALLRADFQRNLGDLAARIRHDRTLAENVHIDFNAGRIMMPVEEAAS